MKIVASIEIQAPVSKVFQIFTSLDQATSILSGIKKLEILEGPEQMMVGTRWRETREMMGKDSTEEMWVSKLTKNTSYTVEAQSHGTKYYSIFTFEDRENTTHVTWSFTGVPQTFAAKLGNILSVLFARSLKKMLIKDLQELKIACEKG